ncbi:hypothetical protein VZT92_008140 [Zoarces viviparus]|uniref:Uncharacterized protein n=1 Tax=Zoarces viviparus TaxID=48416 RepID=A0AAW1FMN2_ZOAVI
MCLSRGTNLMKMIYYNIIMTVISPDRTGSLGLRRCKHDGNSSPRGRAGQIAASERPLFLSARNLLHLPSSSPLIALSLTPCNNQHLAGRQLDGQAGHAELLHNPRAQPQPHHPIGQEQEPEPYTSPLPPLPDCIGSWLSVAWSRNQRTPAKPGKDEQAGRRTPRGELAHLGLSEENR